MRLFIIYLIWHSCWQTFEHQCTTCVAFVRIGRWIGRLFPETRSKLYEKDFWQFFYLQSRPVVHKLNFVGHQKFHRVFLIINRTLRKTFETIPRLDKHKYLPKWWLSYRSLHKQLAMFVWMFKSNLGDLTRTTSSYLKGFNLGPLVQCLWECMFIANLNSNSPVLALLTGTL